MQDRMFTEQDWKLFRTKLAGWQEAYMDRLCKEYIELLSGDHVPSEKFWQLDKRIVFLDIDGVICTTLSTRLSALLRLPLERQIFDPVALFWLRWLVRRSGAEIVLCSSWRDALTVDDPLCQAFIRNLYDSLARNRTPIVDAAPSLPSGDKGEEILAWLTEHPDRQYVVLDDHDCFALGPQVRERWIPIPTDRGMRRKEAKAALNLLL